MSSSSTTPLNQFESLSLDAQMSPTSAQIRSRAVNIRDILSSFDRDVFPSEFRPQIFTELDRPYMERLPASQLTIQEDLPGTLLQWGVYNDQTWTMLTQLQSPATLARCFYEKLSRRINTLLDRYDHLAEEPHHDLQRQIEQVAQGFRDVEKAVKEDRSYRELGHDAIVERLLRAMIEICQRHTNIRPASQTPLTPRRITRSAPPVTKGPHNLYEALIKVSSEDETGHPFMLDLLETFSGQIFKKHELECERLGSLLEINNAPVDYRYRIGRLLSRSTSAALPAAISARSTPSSAAGPSITPVTDPPLQPQRQAQTQPPPRNTPKSGSKRPAEETSAATGRGKKKTT